MQSTETITLHKRFYFVVKKLNGIKLQPIKIIIKLVRLVGLIDLVKSIYNDKEIGASTCDSNPTQ